MLITLLLPTNLTQSGCTCAFLLKLISTKYCVSVFVSDGEATQTAARRTHFRVSRFKQQTIYWNGLPDLDEKWIQTATSGGGD